MATFWLDSTFFSQGEHLTLYITQAKWKDKDAPKVRLNLPEGTAENLPQGVSLLTTERRDGSWRVVFLEKIGTPGNLMSCHGFWDEDGKHYDIWQSGSRLSYRDPETGEWIEEEGTSTEDFALSGFSGSVVYLEPTHNRATHFDVPVAIPIK